MNRRVYIRCSPPTRTTRTRPARSAGPFRSPWGTAGTPRTTGSVPGAVAGGALLGSAGGGKISSAPRADYAEAAAAALTGDGHEGKTYELAGDEAYTLPELAAEISRRAGKAIPYKDLPEADYAAALKGFGLPDGLAQAIASWDVGAAKGALFDDGHQLSKLVPLGAPSAPQRRPRRT
jgi:NAD(P)H dehydrogenase (quinone)